LAVYDDTIWKATKKFKRLTVAIPPLRKQDRSWAHSTSEKSILFAKHLASVFTPNSHNSNDNDLEAYLNAPCQLSLPARAFTPNEINKAIQLLSRHRAPGYDLIDATILKNLPSKAILFLKYIFNSVLRLCHFPIQWKFAQIVMVYKPGKPPTEVTL
jgi:hypothetical protein